MVTDFPVRGSNTVMVITTPQTRNLPPSRLILPRRGDAGCDLKNALCRVRLFLFDGYEAGGRAPRDYPAAKPARTLNCCSESGRGKTVMKVSIEIECTPAEARQFFGLPNVEPMQAAVMEQFQKKMLAEMDRISPEFVMQTWLSLMPSGAEQMQKLFTEMFTQGFGPKK